MSKESGDNTTPSSLPTQQSQALSNNPSQSSFPSSQDEQRESETTLTFKTPSLKNEEILTFIDVFLKTSEKREE